VISLDTVVGVLPGVVPWCRLQLLEHDRVRRRSIGDHLNRCHLGGADRPLEEPAGRAGVPVWRYEDIDDLAELIDRGRRRATGRPPSHTSRPPPAIPNPVPTGSSRSRISQQGREPLHPSVDRHVIYFDTTVSEQFLDITVGQAETQVPAHGNDDHVGREAEAGEGEPRD
jgi:hypothetical protein